MIFVLIFLAVSVILLIGNLALGILEKKRIQLAYNIAVLAILVLLSLAGLAYGIETTFLNVVSVNPFSLFFIAIFSMGMLLVNLLAYAYSDNYGDFAILSVFALAGMYMLSMSNSLITVFIGLELASLPSVFIILLSKKSVEAAVKFFIMASIAISLLSLAIVLFYGGSGSLTLTNTTHSEMLAFAAVLFIVSLGIDASVFPFNLLIPDVYEGSPAYVTGMLGGLNKKVAFAALIQILILAFIGYRSVFDLLAVFSVITMFFGNIVAIMQKNLKRMLAYSSISQAGYILIGMATAGTAGLMGSLFQIFAHAFAFIGILGVVAWLESKQMHTIDDLNGLSRKNRFAALAMSLFMLTFVGLPFTTGFVGKFLIFLGAASAGLAWLAVLGIINSVISIYYYSRPIMAAYSVENKGMGSNAIRHIKMEKPVVLAISIAIIITVVFGVYPQPLIAIAHNAATYLLGA
jgi:NADH-quinone oxidoreductase subunit N